MCIYIYTLGSSARFARALAYRITLRRYITAYVYIYISRQICYGRYPTADIVRQVYYGRYVMADILQQVYYGRHITAHTLRRIFCV